MTDVGRRTRNNRTLDVGSHPGRPADVGRTTYVCLLLIFVLGAVSCGWWTVSPAWADEDPYQHTVYLTNGNQLVGVIDEEDDGTVWIRVPGGRLRLNRERIDHVEMTSAEVKAKLLAEQSTRRKGQTDGSSGSLPPASQMVSTETPLDTLDHPTGWWADIRSRFSAFVNRIIARSGKAPAAPAEGTQKQAQKKGKSR